MKKAGLLFLLILAGFCVFGQSNNFGVITMIGGTVELKSSSSSSFVPAKEGDIVREDTVIFTYLRSTAIVKIGSAVITVRPLTRMTLLEIITSSENENLNLNINTGRVKVDVSPPSGTKVSLTVTSSWATASVRGTSFEFDTRGVFVEYGAVNFRGNRKQEFVIYGGSEGIVGKNGMALDPINLGRSALNPIGIASPGSIGGGTGPASPGSDNPGDPGNPSGPDKPPSGSGPGPGPGPGPGSPGDGDTGVIIIFN